MVCIYCSSATHVTNSRHQRRGNAIWRRRECLDCGAIFTSREQADLSASLRIEDAFKKKLSPFVRDRLFLDIYDSCRHRDSALADAAALTQTIIDKLVATNKSGLITRDDIIVTALAVLKNFDDAAATFYHAYHQDQNRTA